MLDPLVSSVLLVATLVVFTVIGLRARRPEPGDVASFTLARGTQGAGTLGLSFLASGLGAWILFAPAELGVLLGIGPVIGYALAAAGPFLIFAFVGPRLRRLLPSGHGLGDLVRVRFGRTASIAVTVVSLLYMGVFVAAELVAIGGLVELLGGVDRRITVPAVVAATLLYTATGGLRASLRTDRWQAWLVVVLLVGGAIVAVTRIDAPVAAVRDAGLLQIDGAAWQSAATLILAVTAANMFHHGYWQRVWAASDDAALRRGALVGAAATVPLMLIAGLLGMLAAAIGIVEVPALSLFALAGTLPTVAIAGVLVLGIALVTSSVDTLENGLAALLVAERPSWSLSTARILTVVIMVPAMIVGLIAESVLQLFLIADLLAAVLLIPALLGLWRRATTPGVLAGIVAGIVGAVGVSAAVTGSLAGAWEAVTFPDAIPTLPPFVGALVASGLVTFVVSRLTAPDGPTDDLTGLDEQVQARRATAELPR
ncbi:MAG: hypothetical protein JJT89_01660 [Nitriliruptoraceae bacterium]|nr:hypothetical protein [Nitriliruptoraceae bacterium]